MKKILIAVAFFVLGSTFSGYAQAPLSILEVVPYLEVDSTSGIIEPLNISTQPFIIKTNVLLSSISNIQNLHIKIGRQVDASDVVNISIPYNYTTLPTGVTEIIKEQNYFFVDFGIHTNVYTLHVEVWAEDTNGTLTEVYQQRVN